MTPKPLRLLIAGCGDLGSRVANKLLLEPGNCVWGLRRTRDERCESAPGFEWLVADLSKPETLAMLPADITHVLFCAAPNSRTESAYRDVYFNGLKNVAERALNPNLNRILFVSSSAVYGAHGDEWVDEETPVSPQNFNGRILLESEQWLSRFCQEHAIKSLSLRLSGIYGPGRVQLLEKLKLGLVGAPSLPIHWANRIHVEDAANAILHLMNLPDPMPTYLVTDSTPLPLHTLYESLARLVNGPTPTEAAAPSFVGSKRLSNARLRASGFDFLWPNSVAGYASLIQSG
ncbi:SDR family oxidoreductase [Zwartia sp.]|uniref:SDR family oxidoreductase n=1 Tax=Zwartia sp. TaxID=2978004 RepID=UPI003BAFFD21